MSLYTSDKLLQWNLGVYIPLSSRLAASIYLRYNLRVHDYTVDKAFNFSCSIRSTYDIILSSYPD